MGEHSRSSITGSELGWEPAAEPHIGEHPPMPGDWKDLHTNEEKFVSVRVVSALECLGFQ